MTSRWRCWQLRQLRPYASKPLHSLYFAAPRERGSSRDKTPRVTLTPQNPLYSPRLSTEDRHVTKILEWLSPALYISVSSRKHRGQCHPTFDLRSHQSTALGARVSLLGNVNMVRSPEVGIITRWSSSTMVVKLQTLYLLGETGLRFFTVSGEKYEECSGKTPMKSISYRFTSCLGTSIFFFWRFYPCTSHSLFLFLMAR